MARDHSRLRKLLQVQRHHLVNAELAVRWWAHFDIFHHYTSVPIHTAVPATDLFATEQFYIQELQPSLNFGFIERHFRPRTGFIRQLDFSQSRHMGFATIWRKRRRLRLPIALQQAFLARRMNNRLDLWRFLGDLGSNTLRRFDAIRYIRSRDFPPAALYVLHRIATHLPEPHHQACLSAIRSSLRFRGLIPPGPSRPMLAPFLAHPSFRSLLLTQLRGFIRSATRSALPFHMAQPRIVFKAHRRLSSALFSHLQAAKTWSLGETTCTCTDLAQRHPSLPKHDGHLLFSGADTHELFDSDTAHMLSGSMRNSFFPPRGVLMSRLTQAFQHWARTNNLPALDPSTLTTIVEFHFDLHLSHTSQYFLHAHVQRALHTLEPLVRHCEDHADSRLMIYCPVLYGKMLEAAFADPAIFAPLPVPAIEIHQRLRETIVTRFRGRYPWAVTGFGRPANAYILPKRKKNWTTARPIISFIGAFFRPMLDALAKLLHSMVATACPDAFSGGDLFELMRSLHEFLSLGHTYLDYRNQDLSGFFTSIDKDRFLAAWRLLLTWYRQRQPHSSTTHLTVDTLDTSAITRVYNGRRRRHKPTQRTLWLDDIPEIIQATLDMQIFSVGLRSFRQTRGAPMGSPASPALCLMVIAVAEQCWTNTHITSGLRSVDDTLLLRYVDNRLVIATPRWLSTPAANILCDEHFYGGDIFLETEAALDFLGFRLNLTSSTISFIPSHEKHNMLSVKSAAPMIHKESGYYSRRTLISRVSFPEFQRDQDLAMLKRLYLQHGFTLQREEKPSFAKPHWFSSLPLHPDRFDLIFAPKLFDCLTKIRYEHGYQHSTPAAPRLRTHPWHCPTRHRHHPRVH